MPCPKPQLSLNEQEKALSLQTIMAMAGSHRKQPEPRTLVTLTSVLWFRAFFTSGSKTITQMETENLQHQSSECLTETQSHQQLNQNHREGKGSSE